MSRKITILGVVGVLAVAMFATAGVAFAQDPVDQPPCAGYEYSMRGGWRFGGTGSSMLYVLADLLEMAPEDLIAEVQAGASLIEIAETNGLTEVLAEAMLAPRSEAIQAAVEAGRITQEQADEMIERMRERMLSQIGTGECLGVPGSANGGARGGRGGMMGGRFGGRMGGGFADADGDGICDMYDSGGSTSGGRWNTQPGQAL